MKVNRLAGSGKTELKNEQDIKEYLYDVLTTISMAHPEYPDYVYDIVDGKLVSVKADESSWEVNLLG